MASTSSARPLLHRLQARLFASSSASLDATSILLAQASRDLQRSITPQAAKTLAAHGAAVVDGALSPAVTAALRLEFQSLPRAFLRPNSTHFVDPGASKPRLLQKPGILEAEATLDAEAQEHLPLWTALSGDGALRALLSVHLADALEERRRRRLRRGRRRAEDDDGSPFAAGAKERAAAAAAAPLRLDAQTIKLQRNDGGGGCFPVHCDASEGSADDGRVVTAILYLTPSQGYDPAEHGGQLRLFPLRPPAAGSAVDVEPREGRLVLFSSARMPHRVLPARGERVRECATFWLGRSRPLPLAAPPAAATRGGGSSGSSGGGSLDEQLERLLSPRLRTLAARVLLAREWEASLVESHAPGDDLEAALATHRRELGVARAALEEKMGLGDALAALAGERGGAATAAAMAAAQDMDWF